MEPNKEIYFLSLLLLLPCKGDEVIQNVTGSLTGDGREPRANRRVVRLYSGVRPKPIMCTGEGFQADPDDCSVFHRCMKSGNGKYLSFRFQCGPGTIYDPESEICNHPERTSQTGCGADKRVFVPNIDLSFDNDISRELPSPISTKDPISQPEKIFSANFQASTATKYPWGTASHTNAKISISTARTFVPTKAVPTKRHITESFSYPVTSIGITLQKIRSTTPKTFPSVSQSDDICESEGFKGDSENCRKFYRCINNQRGGFIRYEFLCNEPTIWDDEKKICNHAWSVKHRRCGRVNILNDSDSILTNENQNSLKQNLKDAPNTSILQSQLQINYGTKVNQIQTQISDGSAIQNQTQINYSNSTNNELDVNQNQTQIAHGDAVSQIQTQSHYGDKAVQTQLQIDHSKDSSQAQTQISQATSTSKTTKYQEVPVATSTNSNNGCIESGFMGDSKNCKKFYRCVNNGKGGFTRYEFSCGDGTVWDPKVEACNHEWAVKECGGKIPTESTSQSSYTTTAPAGLTKSTTISSNPSTVSTTSTSQSYPSAIEHTTEEIDIPYGNPPVTSASSQQVTNAHKEPQDSQNNNCKLSGFVGDIHDCKKFYRCVDNGDGGYTRHEFTCGEGTVWDQKIEACNHAWAVPHCGEHADAPVSSTLQTIVTSSTQISSQLSTEDNDDPGYGIQNDDLPDSSTTKSTTSNPTSTASPSLGTSSNNMCTSNGFMGDSRDCKKFYRCVENGSGSYTKYEFACGEGTVWDSKINACNHEWAVKDCGENTVEDTDKVDTTTKKDSSSTTLSTQPIDENDVGYGQPTKVPVTVSTTHPTQQATASNKCTSSGFMGDQNDCKKFYRCVDNSDGTFTRYEFECGEGTVWDTKIEACNHAWAVENCGKTSSPQTTLNKPVENDINYEDVGGYPVQNEEYSSESATSSTVSSSTLSPNTNNKCESTGFKGDNTDCKKFYRCVDDSHGGYIRYEFACGEGTVWDQSIEACNHAWAVNGTCSQTGSSSTQATTQVSSSSDNSIDTGVSENGNTQSEVTGTTTTSTFKPSGNQCQQEGFFGDENNCQNFYRCVVDGHGGFIKYDFSCGQGTIWNQDIQTCDHESSDHKCITQMSSSTTGPFSESDEMTSETISNRPESSTSNNANNDFSDKPSISSDKCENEGFYGNPYNCKKFYRCVSDGKGGYIKYEFTCGEGTYWDQEVLACNHETSDKNCKSSATINNTLSPESGSTESTSASQENQISEPSDVSSEKDECIMEGFFANSDDCQKFYRCVSNGKGGYTKYNFACGEGTVWVQEIQACDYDNDISSCSNKNNSSKPHTNEESTTSSQTSPSNEQNMQPQAPDKDNDEYYSSTNNPTQNEQCKSEGFFANPNDCRQFYRCVESGQGTYTKYDFTCGEGTAWDTNIQTCNHISDVKSCQNYYEHENQQNPSNDENSSNPTNNTSTTKESTSTESYPSSSDKCNEEGYFGNTKDCTKFYRCVDDGNGGYTKYDFNCGEGTIWDQDLTTCNHPQDVANPSCSTSELDHSSSSTSSTESSDMNSSSSTTIQSTSDDSMEGTSNCSHETTSKKPSNQNVKCEKAGYFADPDDCKKFYRCVDWDGDGTRFSVYHFECGEGTIWDPALDTCNHEDSVYPPRDCSGTQSQNQNETQATTTTTTENPTTSSTENISTPQSSEETTTQQSTTEQTTTEQQITSEQTSTEKTTAMQTTTIEQSTTTQESTSEQTTHASTTSEQTTQSLTTSEQTTYSSTTSEQTTHPPTTNKQTTQQSSTSEATTEQSTTSEATTEQQTSEQTTQSSLTTQQSTTTDQTLTTTEQTEAQSTTEQTTTPENLTGQETTSTEASTTTTTESGDSTTTEGSESTTSEEPHLSDKECPETEEDQYLYVCPTSFRRHPKYCNMFYQCTEDKDSHDVKIAMFKCPNNTIYDENISQCVEEEKADKKCNGQIARKQRVKRKNTNLKEPIEASRHSHKCSTVGYHPFEKEYECSGAFLKCQSTKYGKLRGYVYRCPEGYTFWSISKRCEKNQSMNDCKQTANNWRYRWEIPVEYQNIAK